MVIGWWLLLLACGDEGPDRDTRVSGLSVVAAVSSKPEVRPGENFEVEVHLLDPDDEPRDLAVWFCTLYGDGCAESGPLPTEVAPHARVVRDARVVERFAFQVPRAVEGLLTPEEGSRAFVFWALACRPGVCEIMDRIEAAPSAGSDAWQALVADMAQPTPWLRELPFEETSFAVRNWLVSDRRSAARIRNPPLEYGGEPLGTVTPNARVLLPFGATSVVYPLATAGAFDEEASLARAGTVSLVYHAPETPGWADLVVVAELEGGSAVWRGSVEVVADPP